MSGWGAAAAAGTSLLGTGLSALSTNNQNRKSREWSDRMYDRQYKHAYEMWNYQNEYNKPQNQVARLKAAGLNPALMYGQSASGASGNAGSISKTDVQPAQFKSPDFSGIQSAGAIGLNAILDSDLKGAQTDNLKSQNGVNQATIALKAAQASETIRDTSYKTRLEGISAQAAEAALHKLRTDTKFTLDENTRKQAMHGKNMEESMQRVMESKARIIHMGKQQGLIQNQINNGIKDLKLKDFELELNKQGFTKGDAVWWRAFTVQVNRLLDNLGLGYLFNFNN